MKKNIRLAVAAIPISETMIAMANTSSMFIVLRIDVKVSVTVSVTVSAVVVVVVVKVSVSFHVVVPDVTVSVVVDE